MALFTVLKRQRKTKRQQRSSRAALRLARHAFTHGYMHTHIHMYVHVYIQVLYIVHWVCACLLALAATWPFTMLRRQLPEHSVQVCVCVCVRAQTTTFKTNTRKCKQNEEYLNKATARSIMCFESRMQLFSLLLLLLLLLVLPSLCLRLVMRGELLRVLSLSRREKLA